MNTDVVIIGGGITGLIAAIELEKQGKSCMILDRNPRLGGRIMTDVINDIPLDRGFQVLLTAYPGVKKYLDDPSLRLQTFQPGAFIIGKDQSTTIGDPMRDLSSMIPTLKSWVGTISDKMKILSLSRKLKRKSVADIFTSPSTTTKQYLKDFGFSEQMIGNFFKPFFTGIFLEPDLATSSRAFEFIFKMFTEGHAAIPADGMEEIPKLLASKLQNTTILLNQNAEINSEGKVVLQNNKVISSSVILRAHPQYQRDQWKGCFTYYYIVDRHIIEGNYIGLIQDDSSTINSLYYLDHLKEDLHDPVLSCTVVDSGKSEGEVRKNVERELQEILGLKIRELLKVYHVPYSLPIVDAPTLSPDTDSEIIAGIPVISASDSNALGSTQGAISAGEAAANKILELL